LKQEVRLLKRPKLVLDTLCESDSDLLRYLRCAEVAGVAPDVVQWDETRGPGPETSSRTIWINNLAGQGEDLQFSSEPLESSANLASTAQHLAPQGEELYDFPDTPLQMPPIIPGTLFVSVTDFGNEVRAEPGPSDKAVAAVSSGEPTSDAGCFEEPDWGKLPTALYLPLPLPFVWEPLTPSVAASSVSFDMKPPVMPQAPTEATITEWVQLGDFVALTLAVNTWSEVASLLGPAIVPIINMFETQLHSAKENMASLTDSLNLFVESERMATEVRDQASARVGRSPHFSKALREAEASWVDIHTNVMSTREELEIIGVQISNLEERISCARQLSVILGAL